MPAKGVNRIVTSKILKYDKVSCDRILRSILMDKQDEDARKAFLRHNRTMLRSKLKTRHNETM